MKRIIVALILAALAGQASATIGSVISSFYIGITIIEPIGSYYRGIYRDSSYVYSLRHIPTMGYLITFTPSGSVVKTEELIFLAPYDYLGDATGCHLGTSYLAFSVTGGDELIYIATTNNASILQSFGAEGPGGEDPYDIMWDGRYYHVHNNEGRYNLYTPAGSSAGQWTVAGWPAGMWATGSTFSKSFNNASGRYLLVAGGLGGRDLYCGFNMDDGSLVASFSRPPSHLPCYGQHYGDAYPARFGGAIWHHAFSYVTNEHWAYQVDIDARGATNVLPASIGKIKAIYR